MPTQQAGLEEAIAAALQKMRAQRDPHFVKAIQNIVHANMARRRLHYYLGAHAGTTVTDYVWHVAAGYDRWQPYLHKVQVDRCPQVWEQLWDKTKAWIYCQLRRWSLDANAHRWTTVELADLAGAELLTARFPFDTEFDPWACVVVKNVCNQEMTRREQVERQLDLKPLEDKTFPVALGRALETAINNRYDLQRAIAQLSDCRRQVIEKRYFQGRSFPEIAQEENVTPNTIYKRHHDALVQLRHILDR